MAKKKEEKKKQPQGSILVPVDFSPISETVIAQAAEFADGLGKPLVVLHVVHDPGEAPGYYQVKGRKKMIKRAEDVAREMLDRFVAESREKLPDSKAMRQAESILVIGLPVTRILEVVDRIHPWMVVMGSEGRTGLSHFLLGSKAEQILRMCPVPVTIVKVPQED